MNVSRSSPAARGAGSNPPNRFERISLEQDADWDPEQDLRPRTVFLRAEVRECLRTLRAGREGLICCSCHNVQAGAPLENLFAMVQTDQQS